MARGKRGQPVAQEKPAATSFVRVEFAVPCDVPERVRGQIEDAVVDLYMKDGFAALDITDRIGSVYEAAKEVLDNAGPVFLPFPLRVRIGNAMQGPGHIVVIASTEAPGDPGNVVAELSAMSNGPHATMGPDRMVLVSQNSGVHSGAAVNISAEEIAAAARAHGFDAQAYEPRTLVDLVPRTADPAALDRLAVGEAPPVGGCAGGWQAAAAFIPAFRFEARWLTFPPDQHISPELRAGLEALPRVYTARPADDVAKTAFITFAQEQIDAAGLPLRAIVTHEQDGTTWLTFDAVERAGILGTMDIRYRNDLGRPSAHPGCPYVIELDGIDFMRFPTTIAGAHLDAARDAAGKFDGRPRTTANVIALASAIVDCLSNEELNASVDANGSPLVRCASEDLAGAMRVNRALAAADPGYINRLQESGFFMGLAAPGPDLPGGLAKSPFAKVLGDAAQVCADQGKNEHAAALHMAQQRLDELRTAIPAAIDALRDLGFPEFFLKGLRLL